MTTAKELCERMQRDYRRQYYGLAEEYNMLSGTYPTPALCADVRPVSDCAGCGARDYAAGRCTYCGRQA